MYDENADKTVVMLVLSGNSEMYGDIVHRYKNIVFNAVYSMIKNHHTAEDLTQETFIDGYIKLKSLQDPCKIGTWLVKMAKNKARNHITRSSARFESELQDYLPDSISSTPENFLIEQQERQALRNAIQQLPELNKTVTELYYFANFSQKEIAEKLNIPVGTVSRRLYDARLKLKKELENMDNNDNISVNNDIEKQVAEKVEAIKNYYSLHNNSYDGFETELDKTVKFIDRLPESKRKHAAYADVFYTASLQDEKHQERAFHEAELSENAQSMVNILIDKYIDFDEFESKINDTIPKIQKMPQNPDNNNAIGELLFWRGSRKFIKGWENADIDKLNEAKIDFIDAEKNLAKINSYYPNAIAGIKAVDIELNDIDKHVKVKYGVTGEGYRYENGKLIYKYQPGFMSGFSKNSHNNVFWYVSSLFDRTFFDENMEIGGKIIGTEDKYKNKSSTHTLISKNEKVTVLAGTFTDCMHINLQGIWYDNYNAEVYYAKGVGLVKAEFTEGDTVENYELSEYKINDGNVGSEYFPFAVGNTWKYLNTNLSPMYWQTVEYELINIHPDDNGVYANFSAVHYVRLYKPNKFNEDCDSDEYITVADGLVTGAVEVEDFDNAIRYLKFALRKNSSSNATIFALNALDYLEKCREYKIKDYRFLPMRMNSSSIIKKDDKILYNERGKYDVAPHRMGSRHEENKIFGMKPFRYLHQLANTLYSEKWIAGYSEQIKHDSGDLYINAENVGDITVKAGTFANCIKVTFDLSIPDDKSYFGDGFSNVHYGKKIYYYAPNVGIVKHDCIWGESLSSVCELTQYKSIATDGEYMPIYIGNWWVYDEMTIESNYKAQIKYDIVSGMDNEFFMIYSQEFLYLGTEVEYEEFKRQAQ